MPQTNKIRGNKIYSRKAAKSAKEEEGLFRRGLSLAKPQRSQRKKRDGDENFVLGALCDFARSALLRGFAASREKFGILHFSAYTSYPVHEQRGRESIPNLH